MKFYKVNKAYTALILSLCNLYASAQDPDPFLGLDLQEVLELEITSVSKKPQTISRAAAAVFVITGDDIRRAGAQNLPDALRLAPGMQVAQLSSNAWAVTARGSNGRFANKLLVMIDGRTAYLPLFSGVPWEMSDVVLADVDRIEVIRGPGAAQWGANAVNGVINIITKSAAATQGSMVDARTGTDVAGDLSMRYGGELEGLGHWRIYGKAVEKNAFELTDGRGKGMDRWRQQRIGLRTDINPSAYDAITLIGEIQQATYGESAMINRKAPPSTSLQGIKRTGSGGYLLARWQRDLRSGNSLTMQSYFDQTKIDWPAHTFADVKTVDFDMQYRHKTIDEHDIVVGTAFRQNSDDVHLSTTGLDAGVDSYETFSVARLRTRMWSFMVQDDVSLVPEKLILTIGAKLEKYETEDIKPLPNLRVMWTPHEHQTVWASASKAIRTPSRIDRNGLVSVFLPKDLTINGLPSLPRPVFGAISGNSEAEQLWAYEIGWKQRLGSGLTIDTTAYYNDYSKLRTQKIDPSKIQCLPYNGIPLPPGTPSYIECFLPTTSTNQYLLVQGTLGNELSGHSQGVEVWLDWQASRQQRWQASVTRYSMTINHSSDPNVNSLETGTSSPKWSGSVRWSYTPNKQTEADVVIRHAGALANTGLGQSIAAYTAADMRLAWNSSPQVQWHVTGRNLLTSRHLEFSSEVNDVAHTLISPSVVVGVRILH